MDTRLKFYSSSGLGYYPFTVGTRVRIPHRTPKPKTVMVNQTNFNIIKEYACEFH